MFGARVHRAVIASGATVSGASVHVVDEEYDTGAVVAQRSVEVRADDTPDILAARVQTAERDLIVQVLREIAVGGRPLPLGAPRP
jgi:phosphoribosylglycinamide formyltransferase-1